MSHGARERPSSSIQGGLLAGDALAGVLFPGLSGQVEWGLERTKRILASRGDPHRDYPVLHVGGTNGKGSVARIWSEILHAAGFRTGLYTSPHLISFRERIQVDGSAVPDKLLEEWSRDLRPLLLHEEPSFFEAATALAFLALSRMAVDVAVVEVGMGGRLDATNVVDPVLTAVTNVSLDHQEMLGGTVEHIAREKAGIFKPGVPAFTADEDPRTLAVLAEEAATHEALLCTVPPPAGEVRLDGLAVRLDTQRWGSLDLESPLIGRHQLRNLALAVQALEALPPWLPVPTQAVRDGVSRVRLAGRFQVERDRGQVWILDVAHNLEGVRVLRQTIDEIDPPRPRVGVVGILADKPWEAMLQQLAGVLDHVVLTVPSLAPETRAWEPGSVAAGLASDNVEVRPLVASAVKTARSRAGRSGSVVVTGSTYTVGECLVCLDKIPPEALPTSFDTG